MRRRQRRDGAESGFTLIELLIVVVIIGALVAIAVPAYAGFKSRGADATAKSRLREAATAAVAYSLDNIGTASDPDRNAATTGFQGMTPARLRLYDRGIASGSGQITVLASKTTTSAYCIRVTVETRRWSLLGPNVNSGAYKNNLNCN